MYIYDQRKLPTCRFSQLNQGDLFAYEDGDELFYLMVLVVDNDGYCRAVVLGARESDTDLTGAIWKFNEDEEVQPLKGELKVWAN